MRILIVNKKTVLGFILSITIIIFFSTVYNGFQNEWDDTWMLLENPFVIQFSWRKVWFHMTHFYEGQFSPVNTLFYVFVYQLFGMKAWVFHLGCLAVHLLNGVLVYCFLEALISKLKRSYKMRRVHTYAGVVTLIFLIHPLQVESVAWISASKVLLYSFFTLCGLSMYLKYINSGKSWLLVGVLICYLLGFASKEQAILFPVNLVLVDFFLGRLALNYFKWNVLKRRVVIEKVPFLLVAVFMYLF